MKNLKKWLSIIVFVIMLLSFVACGQKKEDNTVTVFQNDSKAKYTIAELKREYNVLGNESQSKYLFKPFYNVEQTTEFTFRFKSNVDPIKAVTVHTDSKCEENSIVYQLNDGYKTNEGVDVVVKPKDPVLKTTSRNNNSATNCWGYAPIYYLCVHYDLDSTTVKKLDEPIVIPFTVKSEITAPTAYAKIDGDGVFSVAWNPVENAKSYKIYSAYAPSTKSRDGSRAEYGFVGEKLKLLKTVDASVNEYVGGELYQGDSGFVASQNLGVGTSTYYITAVDSSGNESLFSRPVCDWLYSDVIPTRYRDVYARIEQFPDTVMVESVDGKTEVKYPIHYYKNGNPALYSHTCEYRYEILGTKLTGVVTYYNVEDIFPESHISSYKRETGSLQEVNVDDIIPVDVANLIDSDYQNTKIDLQSKVTYPESAKIQLDNASLIRRADIEAARQIVDGAYTTSLSSISSYVANDNPEYIAIVGKNGTIEVIKAENDQGEKDNSNETGNQNEIGNSNETENQNETGNLNETGNSNETTNSNEMNRSDEIPSEINNNNYVEEQRKSTEKQVEEADKEVIEDTEYPIFVDNAAQKYLALSLINQEEKISLKAFPEYQDIDALLDDLLYVWYQNPYIMGFDITNSEYHYQTQILEIDYNVNKTNAKKYQEAIYKKSKQVVNEIIQSGMDDYSKVIAIWDYLEKNSQYNTDAYKYATTGASDFYKEYPNSWNTYGILCEKSGVCQSYAYAFKLLAYESGLESVMVTGSMNNGGHAWNAVKLNGTWYMVDTTNNISIGIPYWTCNASTRFIYENGFVFDDGFVDGENVGEFMRNDDKKDWYYVNGMMPTTISECVDTWQKYKNQTNTIIIKYQINTQAELTEFMNQFIKELARRNVEDSEVMGWGCQEVNGMLAFVKNNS